MPKIVIDPGHGGHDSGAVGVNGLWESHVVLGIALDVRDILKPLCDVMLTRETDTFVSLSERCRMANDWGADIYVSIHLNASTNANANGWEVFTSGSTGSQKLAGNLAYAHATEFPSQTARGVKGATFYILKHTSAPAVLWEGGFLSNQDEADWLGRQDIQQRCAQAIAAGIVDFFSLTEETEALTLERRVARIEEHLGL